VSATFFLLILSFRSTFETARCMALLTFLSALPALSALWSDASSLSLRRGAFVLFSSLLGYHFASHYSPEKQIKIFSSVGVIAALSSCLMALVFPRFGLDHMVHAGAWRGIYSHKNLCAFAMILFISPLFGREGRMTTLPRVAYAVLLLFILGMTQSRTGWIVCSMYVAAMCTLKCLGKFNVRDSRILAIAGALVIAGAVSLLSQNVEGILGLMGRDLTFSGRTNIWQAVFDAVMQRPLLGYGYAAFWQGLQGASSNIILTLGWAVPHAHNGFLEVWLQLGFVGLSLLIVTLVVAIRDFSVCFTPTRPRVIDWYAGILIVVVLYNFAEPSLVAERSLAWVLYVTACVGLRRSAMAMRGALRAQ
jgi:exopolysaccharide production protein ExoQ